MLKPNFEKVDGLGNCLFGRTEILALVGLQFGRNDDLINSF